MIDPQKLLDSATRLYGDAMDRLWGEFLPTPAANVRALDRRRTHRGRRAARSTSPTRRAMRRTTSPTSTARPAWRSRATRRAAASARPRSCMPPTPPPDIDLDLWRASAATILAWRPKTLFLTHFGPSPTDPVAHLAELMVRLQRCRRNRQAGAAARRRRRRAGGALPRRDAPRVASAHAGSGGGRLRAGDPVRPLLLRAGEVLEEAAPGRDAGRGNPSPVVRRFRLGDAAPDGAWRATPQRPAASAGRERIRLRRTRRRRRRSVQEFEKLGAFYLGRPYDLATARLATGRPLRLAGPRHARGDHRHDRQRQDRPRPRPARGSGHRRRAGHRHRPQGRPRQPAADVPRPFARRRSARGSTQTRPGARASARTSSRRARPRPGRRGSRRGARTARASRS